MIASQFMETEAVVETEDAVVFQAEAVTTVVDLSHQEADHHLVVGVHQETERDALKVTEMEIEKVEAVGTVEVAITVVEITEIVIVETEMIAVDHQVGEQEGFLVMVKNALAIENPQEDLGIAVVILK